MILVLWSERYSIGSYTVFGKHFDSEESEAAKAFMDGLDDKGVVNYARYDFFDVDSDLDFWRKDKN